MTAIFHVLNPQRQLRFSLTVLVILTFIGAAVLKSRVAHSRDQDIQKLNRFVQTTKTDTPAMKMFREGRDLIEAENWQKAAEKFNGFISEFPKDRDVDAALYWFAYALQKQGKKEAAAAPLLRLVKDFPSSSWRREADAMLVVLGQGQSVQQALDRSNCEIKVLALQSLFEADKDRALNFVTEVLKANPPADCPSLKTAAVSLLGSYGGSRAIPILLDLARSQLDLKLRLTAIRRLGEQNNDSIADELARLYDGDRTKEIRSQILRALAEMGNARAEGKLIEVARSGDDLAARQTAIRYLGERDGTASLEELLRIFDADRTPEIRTQILRSLAERSDPRAQAKLLEVARKGETPELRIEAIRRLGERGRISIEDLLTLYSSETNVSIKQGLIRVYAETDDPRARVKLFEIAKSGDSPDLRLYAIRRLGEKNDDQTVEQLTAMYDAETNFQVKGMLIRAFGDSNQKAAVRKLMSIARNDSSVDLRKLAVRLLGESKDPEALKFLEELLK
jgi:HEAT repeat protein